MLEMHNKILVKHLKRKTQTFTRVSMTT